MHALNPVQQINTAFAVAENIPSPLMAFVYGINRIHGLWRWHRRADDLYRSENSLHQLLAGHSLQWLVGQRLIVKIAAQVVLVVRRLTDLVAQQRRLAASYRDWKQAITWQYQPPLMTWNATALPTSYTKLRIKITLHRLTHRLYRIAITTFYLIKDAFLLSMRMLDQVEAMSLNPATREAAVNELFLNSSRLMDQLSKDKPLLLKELRENKTIVQYLLDKMNLKYTAEDLAKVIESTIDKAEVARNGWSVVQESLTEGIKDGMYTIIDGLFGTAPEFLLPKNALANSCTPLPDEDAYDDDTNIHPPRQTGQQPLRTRCFPPTFP